METTSIYSWAPVTTKNQNRTISPAIVRAAMAGDPSAIKLAAAHVEQALSDPMPHMVIEHNALVALVAAINWLSSQLSEKLKEQARQRTLDSAAEMLRNRTDAPFPEYSALKEVLAAYPAVPRTSLIRRYRGQNADSISLGYEVSLKIDKEALFSEGAIKAVAVESELDEATIAAAYDSYGDFIKNLKLQKSKRSKK